MNHYFFPALLAFTMSSCAKINSQKEQALSARRIGTGCEGFQVIYKTSVPFDHLTWMDTRTQFIEKGFVFIPCIDPLLNFSTISR